MFANNIALISDYVGYVLPQEHVMFCNRAETFSKVQCNFLNRNIRLSLKIVVFWKVQCDCGDV